MPKYMIQKHDASHLHYDFRLEVDGVYKSWAIPKTVPTVSGVPTLAVPTPDHPMDYDLEGVIPEGEYGAGEVLLWDYGEYSLKDPIEEGKISFYLQGPRLEGYYTLVKTGANWLLLCHSAVDDVGTEISVLTGRTLAEIAVGAPFKPQLAKLVSTIPQGDPWVYEPKLDGYRILAYRSGDDVKLYTRRGQDWTDKYPYLVKVLKEKSWSGWLDGELVVGDSFNDTQNSRGDLVYHVFDKPDVPGGLEERKAYLYKAFKHGRTVRPVRHMTRPFDPCEQGYEGLIAKNRNAEYQPGRRDAWTKFKCKLGQEFVIMGYTEGAGKRSGMIGSLLVGYYEDGELIYAGKVGTGFTDEEAYQLYDLLSEHKLDDSPLRGQVRVKPLYVAEVEFMEWTSSSKLRHPTFKGLREDKLPVEVFRERPLTHPNRVVFPVANLTKYGLAAYYASVADRMMPELVGRPLTLLRCPNGVDGECFYQRNVGPGAVPPGLKVITMDGKDYYTLASKEGLESLAQMNVAEIHPWNVRGGNPNPDRMVFDLDPSDGVEWAQVVRVANSIKEELDLMGLKSYVKTSGNKGLHIIVPIEPIYPVGVVNEEARFIAERVCHKNRECTASPHMGARKNRVFVDWLRNGEGATTVAAWSTRARPDATVSAPIDWEDLPNVRGDSFNVHNVLDLPGWGTLVNQIVGALI